MTNSRAKELEEEICRHSSDLTLRGKKIDQISGPKAARAKKRILLEPPDGGWGWLICASYFLSAFLVKGGRVAYSIIFNEIARDLLGNEKVGLITWPITLNLIFSSFLGGPFSAALIKRVGYRKTHWIGGLLYFMSFVLSSFASNVYFLFFSYGVLSGFGHSFLILSAIGSVGRYFKKKHSIAHVFGWSGYGVGAFVLSPLIELIKSNYGWRGTFFMMAAFIHLNSDKLHTDRTDSKQNVSNLTKKEGSAFVTFLKGIYSYMELKIFKNDLYLVQLFVADLRDAAVCVTTVESFLYVNAESLEIPAMKASLLPSISGISVLLSAITLTIFLNKFPKIDRIYVYSGISSIWGISIFLYSYCTNYLSLVLCTILFGFAYGATRSMGGVITKLIVEESLYTSAMAFRTPALGIGFFCGVPFIGYLYDISGSYALPLRLMLVPALLASVIFAAVNFFHKRRNSKKTREKSLHIKCIDEVNRPNASFSGYQRVDKETAL